MNYARYYPIIMLILMLCGCIGDNRPTHGDMQAPPATAVTSAATEDAIAQKADAKSKTLVDAANVKAAQAEVKASSNAQELAIAQANLKAAREQLVKDMADLQASQQLLTDQRKAENDGKLDSYIGYAIPIALATLICLYEGWKTEAAIGGILAVGLIVLPMFFGWILDHGKTIGTLATIGALIGLAYKYRAKIPAIEAAAKKDIQVAETALAHVLSGKGWQEAEEDVKAALTKSYCWIKGIAASIEHKVEAVLHLSKTPTVSQTMNIPAVTPVAPTPAAKV